MRRLPGAPDGRSDPGLDTRSQLAGKVAVVTGASRGLGEAMARALADEGCRVVVAARRGGACATVADAIGGLAVAADVTDEAQVKALMAACERTYGRLDVLVNNAGTVEPFAATEDMPTEAWDAAFAVNVKGVVLCIKHAVPLLKCRGGAIVNISSRAGLSGNPNHGAYSATKFAVNGITEAVAQELGPHGIRVNALCPGAVATEAFVTRVNERARAAGLAYDEMLKRNFTGRTALGRLATVEDVCAAALFLADDRSSAITGATLTLDAGWR